MRNLRNETNNTPYIIASAFATLTLLTSVAIAASSYFDFFSSVGFFNAALTVALVLSILSVLVVVLSYKIVSNNKELGTWKNKLAKRELELENELTLKQEAKETANNQMEELKNQLQQKDKELIDTKRQLDDKCKNISELTTEKGRLEVELKSQEGIQRLSTELKNKVDLNQKNKEFNDKDSEIEKLNDLLGDLQCKKDSNVWNFANLKSRVATLISERGSLVEKCQAMQQDIESKNGYIIQLDSKLTKMEERKQCFMDLDYRRLKEKIKNQAQDLSLKEQTITDNEYKIRELSKQVYSLEQQNKTLADETTICSNKNKRLISFMYEVISNIEREIKDVERLLDREKNEGRQINFKTMEDFLENLKKLYSSTTDGVKGLNIPVVCQVFVLEDKQDLSL
ncbi:coiled-coil domain-containing protein [Wolbachia endosymbiont (group A) of Bombylius major]|uniref:hypothetical protein n=1 Tax=Wolbachia endosymbiont (group A) of Bombylius major TaxID=2953988 RepID=UPI00222F93BF|nr:hypothetical protein [Wolbachia endosymbiont (group A) of Bombylius major]